VIEGTLPPPIRGDAGGEVVLALLPPLLLRAWARLRPTKRFATPGKVRIWLRRWLVGDAGVVFESVGDAWAGEEGVEEIAVDIIVLLLC
jgi:hypothetical protein